MKRCNWTAALTSVVAILLGMYAIGQTPTTTPPATAAPAAQDYSQGFRAFLRLGLPDTAKATYVELTTDLSDMQEMNRFTLYEVQLRGNAWLLAGETSTTNSLLTASGVVLQLVDAQTQRQRLEAESHGPDGTESVASEADDSTVPTGTWKPCDLGRDLDKATAFVTKKLTAKAAGGREFSYDSFMRSDEGPGNLFLLAVLAWQHGRQQEANALAGALFELAGDSRKVIVGAMNVMADAQLAATAACGWRRTRRRRPRLGRRPDDRKGSFTLRWRFGYTLVPHCRYTGIQTNA